MSLADQIIDHGPFEPGDVIPAWAADLTHSEPMNALRDELIELRRLRAAAETRERFEVHASPYRDAEGATLVLDCTRCPWFAETEHDVSVDDSKPLADLVRRADEHGKECR